MTERIVKKLFGYVGVNNLSDEDVLGFIRVTKLDRLPPHLIVVVGTCLPLLEIAVKRLMDEQINWGDLEENV
jgi:hypothetical protein|tara:strand:- start:2856 stop:3071 length:216 start_codon:yes stop_codon:yes gene_type:complete